MVPISETGTEMLGMMVAGRLRRNTKITATTSATASTSSKAASLTEARIMPVESCATVTSMPAGRVARRPGSRSEEHTSELQSQSNLVCRLLLEKKKNY